MNLHETEETATKPGASKPICPKRWLTRSPAVEAACDNYGDVPDVLATAAVEFGTNTASRASGLFTCLSYGKTVLGLMAAIPIIECLERLNKALQGNIVTVEGMLNSVQFVRKEPGNTRSEEYLSNILKDTERKISDLNLHELYVPRQRKKIKKI